MRLLVILIYFAIQINCRPIESGVALDSSRHMLTKYLINFGYLFESADVASIFEPITNLSKGIKHLQKDAGIQETGIMDENVLKLIQTPRCGNRYSFKPRQKRYSTVSTWKTLKNKLNETVITWYFDTNNLNINTSMNIQIIESIFMSTLQKWSNSTLIEFKRVNSELDANITILFAGRNHGDGYNFDGPGQVLAHAFYPSTGRRGGDAHFDLGEQWTLWNEDKGVSLYGISLHEFGHSLGLGHSSQKEAIMYPWFQGYTDLNKDDLNGIGYLYGFRERFAPLDPEYRIYSKPETTTPRRQITPTQKFTQQWMNWPIGRKLIIENSKVFIYPKSATSMNF